MKKEGCNETYKNTKRCRMGRRSESDSDEGPGGLLNGHGEALRQEFKLPRMLALEKCFEKSKTRQESI